MSTKGSDRIRHGRRDTLRWLGMSAGLGLLDVTCRDALGVSAAELAAATGDGARSVPKGAIIRTVQKDVRPDALGPGAIMFHEHLSLSDPYPYQPPPKEKPPPHFSTDTDMMADEVRAAGKDGMCCIVDTGPKDLGRSVEDLRKISTKSGVHVVACGGFFMQSGVRGAPLVPPEVLAKTAEELADDFVQEALRDRLGAFGEIGTSSGLPPAERKVLHAVSLAHLKTNLPIITHTPHTGCAPCAREQAEVFESHGVSLRRVCIGHMSDIGGDPRAETAIAIAKRGAYLGFDTLTLQMQQSTEENKIKMILAVLEAGYEDQVLLSSDHAGLNQLKRMGGAGYSAVLTVFVPKLRYAGVKDATIRRLLNDNPRRFLAFVPKTL